MQRGTGNDQLAGAEPHARPSCVVRHDLDPVANGVGGRRKHPVPRLGDRFGELEVVGFRVGLRGRILSDRGVIVQCSCGAPEYGTSEQNLRYGRVTRCMHCGFKQALATRKAYVGYREVIADDELRNNLLQRINGIYRRCYEPSHADYHNYGGRGLTCWWFEEYGRGAVGKREKAIWRRHMLEHLVSLEGHDRRGYELDRIDNRRGYEPGNLRFINRQGNARNRRTVRELEARIRELEDEVSRLRFGQLRAS